MGSFLSISENDSIYSSREFAMHGGDCFLIPMYFWKQGTLSMRSGTFFGQGSPCEILWLQPRILLQIRSGSAEGWGS